MTHITQIRLWLHQLTRTLDDRLVPLVPHAEEDRNPDKRQTQMLSRALAAMAAGMAAGLPDQDAADRVTDRMHDDGIDAFAVSAGGPGKPVIYLVQAKWAVNGTKGYSPAEMGKLVTGFARLREGSLHPDNPLRDHLPEISPAIQTPGARVVLIFATSSASNVSLDAKTEAEQAVKRIAAGRPIEVECRYWTLEKFARELETSLERGRGKNVSGSLLQDRGRDEHYPALQGMISAAELGQWYLDHDRAIFDDNVRVEMSSGVNDEIADCLRREPENFWYFNSGVTALCEHWEPAPAGDQYEFTGLRIVNGAQTVSSIGRVMLEPAGAARAANAQVAIRFVALKTQSRGFGARIAYANNRVNRIQPRDLLAMDHVQHRLRDEFTLTYGLTYAIRANDSVPVDTEGCSVLEAVIAMACGRHDVATLIRVKADASSTWPDHAPVHRRLFHDQTSVVEVWRRVRVLRAVMAELHRPGAAAGHREKAVAVLADLIIAHVVFRQLGDQGVDDISSNWEDQLTSVPDRTSAALRTLAAVVTSELGPGDFTSKKVRRLLQEANWVSSQVQALIPGPRDPSGPVPTPVPGPAWPSGTEFRLPIEGGPQPALGRRCDGGFLIYAGSPAAAKDHLSLSTRQSGLRNNLRDSARLVPHGVVLRLTSDALFDSASEAAAVLKGHSVNGTDEWAAADGTAYKYVPENER